jgi:hypothetical protein
LLRDASTAGAKLVNIPRGMSEDGDGSVIVRERIRPRWTAPHCVLASPNRSKLPISPQHLIEPGQQEGPDQLGVPARPGERAMPQFFYCGRGRVG